MSVPVLPAIGIEKLKKGEKEVVFTVLGCNCDTETTREYKEGDVVFNEVDESCSKCGRKFRIMQIYADIVKK
ncbi:MAG TPA: hypothetical protein VKM55_22030 [Candidatus Lokiarchaeia archaeon]|nr:hypothetical protein [Candidatus Lokiarchaeia archaeon]